MTQSHDQAVSPADIELAISRFNALGIRPSLLGLLKGWWAQLFVAQMMSEGYLDEATRTALIPASSAARTLAMSFQRFVPPQADAATAMNDMLVTNLIRCMFEDEADQGHVYRAYWRMFEAG